MQELQYPFDEKIIIRRRKQLRDRLLSQGNTLVPLRIAILGGSSTELLEEFLELFLMNEGMLPQFYRGTFGKYYEDVVFDNPELDQFKPELIYFHTGSIILQEWPNCTMTEELVDTMLRVQMDRFCKMWECANKRNCVILQNNFELPHLRLLGNMDGTTYYGRTHYIQRLNQLLLDCSRKYENVHIHDICYLSADYGLQHWYNPSQWYRAKMCPGLEASVYLAYSLSRVIATLFLGSKKMIITDLDNTLWGGIVSEVGAKGLNMAPEDPVGEAHLDYQQWLLEMRRMGTVLCASSKNDEADALSGLSVPECRIHSEDFALIRANWKPKDENVRDICEELRIFPDASVFIDDTESERHLVSSHLAGIQTPPFSQIEELLPMLSRALYFNIASVTEEDLLRSASYSSRYNERTQSYDEYLQELDMCIEIGRVSEAGISRMVQLLNKTNRFNVNGKKYTRGEIEGMIADPEAYILLGGRLRDRVTDHGMICYMICMVTDYGLELEQWVTSCRVFRRGVEHAMMDYLIHLCNQKGQKHIFCKFVQTDKNDMIKDLLLAYGFREEITGNRTTREYVLHLDDYQAQTHSIRII